MSIFYHFRLPWLDRAECEMPDEIAGLEQVPTIMLSVHAPLGEINKRQIIYMRKPFDLFKLLEAIDTLLVSQDA